ncbi:MAG TPA: SDR family oxidoreductase [Chitinophagaceae bacterium]|nr:SDR family oxidoreductase [Chitinophagaceae bacterium]
MILVAGSTGLLGSEICRQLATQQKTVRALVRKTSSPEKINALKQMGCGLAEGDFKDKASLINACTGCDTVITTVSSTLSRQEGDNIQSVDHDGNLNLVAAAKETGVKHFIFISFRHQNATANPLTEAKRTAERAIISSGMKYTILQASIFMEVWLSPALGFNYPDHAAQIPGDGNQLISYVSYKDVAEFAVASVHKDTAKNKTLEIGGPEAISPAQVIKEFEKVSDHPFTVNYIPVAALKQQADEATDYWQKIFTNLMIFYANGDAIDMRPVLEKIPVKLHSIKDYAKSVLKKEEEVAP